MVDRSLFTLYSGGHTGAESEFGDCAERWGIQEVNFSYKGHKVSRDKNMILLEDDELNKGNISMEIVSRALGRRFHEADRLRRIVQSLFHIVTSSDHIFAVGWILENNTVKGGTGWGVELAKIFNRPVSVYDQDKDKWFTWKKSQWVEDEPVISQQNFAGTGTRNLSDTGRKAIDDLFERSFGPEAG